MNQKEVKDASFYVQSEDWSDDRDELVGRLYSFRDQKYPLLNISIWPDLNYRIDNSKKITGLVVEIGYKEKSKDFWLANVKEAIIPVELYDQFMEMMIEAKAKITQINGKNDSFKSKTP